VASGAGNSELFLTSDNMSAMRGVRFLLLAVEGPKTVSGKLRMTDAVAIAGTEALREPRRRAVVLVLNGEEDASRYRSATVRRYLERIGVPLRVWSLTGGGVHPAWGETEDISTNQRLQEAVRRLDRELETQRVAWLPLDPYRALQVEAAAGCAWEPLASGQ
jgi:hypothetical protein